MLCSPRSLLTSLATAVAWLSTLAAAADDDDLHLFVTRPELRAPKYHVQVYDHDQVTPGYWFVAPYVHIEPAAPATNWEPCQIGPYIYDGNGELVWSGACLWDNRNTFDFKMVEIDNQPHLSLIVQHAYNDASKKGAGVILDNTYSTANVIKTYGALPAFNMHEFNVIDNGKSALAATYWTDVASLAPVGHASLSAKIETCGFQDILLETGKPQFEWHALDHVPLNESVVTWPRSSVTSPKGWDYIHINSVDKNDDGDYLVSARFTDTVYKVSGQDGHIVWRLGGKASSFKMLNDLKFDRQHHARFLSSNATHTTVSFLNNASDEGRSFARYSSALIILLTHIPGQEMTAELVQQFDRPDKGLTRLRGNFQTLDNNHKFVSWSENSYHSEFAEDGTLLMEAQFTSHRLSTYRTYKFNFTAAPSEPPVHKSFVYGTKPSEYTTVHHVSWNGATEVAQWNFYGKTSDDGSAFYLGNATKRGFETTFMSEGFVSHVWVEAISKDGKTLHKTDPQRTIEPDNWAAAGFSAIATETTEDSTSSETTGKTGGTPQGMKEGNSAAEETISTYLSAIAIVVVTLAGSAAFVYAVSVFFKRRREQRYQGVQNGDELENRFVDSEMKEIEDALADSDSEGEEDLGGLVREKQKDSRKSYESQVLS